MAGLTLDLNRMSSRRVIERVESRCAHYGKVQTVSLYGFPVLGTQSEPFAVVEMSTPEATAELRAALGETNFGEGVLIPLRQTKGEA